MDGDRPAWSGGTGAGPRIRPAVLEDSEEIARLTTQLGYPASAEASRDRLRRLADLGRGVVFVAEEFAESGAVAGPETGDGIGEAADARAGGALLGWIHVAGQCCLEAEPWAEILGLVVDEDRRRRGVGCELLRRAERWARERGYRRLRLRTNVVRMETHAFYRRRGFEQLKTQHVFVKDLPPAAESGSTAEPTG